MNKITLIYTNDWVTMYGPDGEHLTDYHNIDGERMFRALQDVDLHPNEIELVHEYIKDEQIEKDLFDGNVPIKLQEIRDYQNKG